MSDQVAVLNRTKPLFQLGAPGAPCGGRSTCTDSVGAMIVEAEKGRRISAAQFRRAARPNDTTPCGGLMPAQFLAGLRAFGVKGYEYVANVTAADVLKATDRGIVCLGVGYRGYPVRSEAELGGRTDLGFTGAHAVAIYGRRKFTAPPVGWPAGRPFIPGWRVWGRDPDHHFADSGPAFDRFEMHYLARAIAALIGSPSGAGRWSNTFAVWRQED